MYFHPSECLWASFLPEPSVVVQSLNKPSLEDLVGWVDRQQQQEVACQGFWEMVFVGIEKRRHPHNNHFHTQDGDTITAC